MCDRFSGGGGTYFVNLRFKSEFRKIRTKDNSVFGHFFKSVQLFCNREIFKKAIPLFLKMESCSKENETGFPYQSEYIFCCNHTYPKYFWDLAHLMLELKALTSSQRFQSYFQFEIQNFQISDLLSKTINTKKSILKRN